MLQNVDPAETSFGMAVVFQETFVGAISSISMLAPEPYLTSLLRLDLWLNISQVMSRRQSNLNTLANQTTFEEWLFRGVCLVKLQVNDFENQKQTVFMTVPLQFPSYDCMQTTILYTNSLPDGAFITTCSFQNWKLWFSRTWLQSITVQQYQPKWWYIFVNLLHED